MTTDTDDRTRSLMLPPAVERAPYDLEFARGAVHYLERMGLDRDAIVRALVDELNLDLTTARTLATAA